MLTPLTASPAPNTTAAKLRVLNAVGGGNPLAGGYLFWNLTERCPNKCAFCGQEERYAAPHEEVTLTTFDRVTREAKAEGFREFFFSGGEPGIVPLLPEFAALAKAQGFEVALFTSGAGGAASIARLVAAQPHRATVSIDCAIPEVHDRMRLRPGAFREAFAALTALRAAAGVQTSLHAVVTRDNIGLLDSLVTLALNQGVRHLALSLVLDTSGRSKAFTRPTRAQMREYLFTTLPRLIGLAGKRVVIRPAPLPLGAVEKLESPSELARWLAAHADDPVTAAELEDWARGRYNVAFRERYHCILPLRDLVIAPNGDVYPCSSATVFQHQYAVGNIYRQSLGAIRRGARLREFWHGVADHKACASCHAHANLAGGSHLVARFPAQVPGLVWRRLDPGAGG